MIVTDAVIADFRTYFNGQFGDVAVWPDELLRENLCDAASETGGDGWGDFKLGDCSNFRRRGMFLYAAHLLTFYYGDDPTAGGGIAGQARLNTQSKQVGDESTSYRVAAMMDAGNDALTYTVYGQQFYRLRKRAYLGARAL